MSLLHNKTIQELESLIRLQVHRARHLMNDPELKKEDQRFYEGAHFFLKDIILSYFIEEK